MEKEKNEKIRRYLDGESQNQEFTKDEFLDIQAYESMINESRKLYQSVEVPDLTEKIMTRLPARAPKRGHEGLFSPRRTGGELSQKLLHRMFHWLWAPLPVNLRPIYGIVATTLIAAYLLTGGNLIMRDTAKTDEANIVRDRIFIQFRLNAPGSSTVQLAGSFTNWQPAYTLHQNAPGVWSVLVPLQPGVHDYAFLVNGEWIPDPITTLVDDGFGGVNSRLIVCPPTGDSKI